MNEQDLAFLISQPRSGSTMLQRILGSHRDVLTVAEPWVMLHLAYSLRQEGIYAEFDRQTERKAFSEFINALPGDGRQMYINGLRRLCMDLYAGHLANSGKHLFLDKTPRYYFILGELLEIFPRAKFILLRRHPLSVLYSVIQSWTKENWYRLSDFRHDIEEGFFNIEKYHAHPSVLVTRYEDLIRRPDAEIRKICDYLSVEYYSDVLNYDTSRPWSLGDQSATVASGEIDPTRLDPWQSAMLTFQQWRVLWDYMELIGSAKFSTAGYDYDSTRSSLLGNCPGNDVEAVLSATYSLTDLMAGEKAALYQMVTLEAQRASLEEQRSRLEEQKNKLQEQVDALRERVRLQEIERKTVLVNIDALPTLLRRMFRR